MLQIMDMKILTVYAHPTDYLDKSYIKYKVANLLNIVIQQINILTYPKASISLGCEQFTTISRLI